MPVTQDAAGNFSTELGTKFADDPVLGIVENLGLGAGMTDVLRFYVGILAAVILLIATNAGLIGVSRLTYSMGQHRQLPERLRQVHPRFRTPYIAILAFSTVAAIALIPGETELLATMYSFGAMLSFTIAHVSVIKLRWRHPEREREWRPPLNFLRARQGDPTVGGAGRAGHVRRMDRGHGAQQPHAGDRRGVDAVRARALRSSTGDSQRLPLKETVKVLTPEPLGVEEVEYQSVLVAFDEDPFSEEVVATADRLAARRRRGIHVLALITVPTHLPLDAPLEAEESEAQSKIERAKLICGMRVTGHVERVRPGQAGHVISEDARAIKAAAVVMQLRYRNGMPLYGKTLQTVLAERPCRVIVVAEPESARDGAGAGAPIPVARS